MKLLKNHVYLMTAYTNRNVDNPTEPLALTFSCLMAEPQTNTAYISRSFEFVKVKTHVVNTAGTYWKIDNLQLTFADNSYINDTQCIIVPSLDITIPDTNIWLSHNCLTFEELIDNFHVFFLKNNAEPERLNKQTYLNMVSHGTGTLRESSSVVNPIITFEWTLGVAPSFNYVYIPQFERFYFVTNITFMANKLWVMELNCDVLMTYYDEIVQNNAYIERQQTAYDLSVVDDMLTPENRITITETEYTNKFFYTDITDRYSHTYESACPVVTAIGGIASYVGGAVDPTPDTSSTALRKLPWETFGLGLVTLYSMSPKALNDWMMSGNMQSLETIFTDFGEYIVGCKCFPFDVTALATSSTTDNPVKIGSKNATGLSAIRMNAFNNIKTIVSSFSVPRIYSDFRDFAPYTKVTAFLPYIGYVDLPTNDVMGKTGMSIDYAFDLIDGTCQAFIRTGTRIIVTTERASCALDLPINQKNNSERLRNLLLGSLNILSGGIASAVGDASGLKSAMKGVSGMMGFMTEHVTKGRITGGWQSMNSPTSVTIVVETQKWVNVDMTEFAKLHGRPCHKTYDLDDLVGLGFTQVGSIHLENIPTATDSEITEIESQLKNGVIL